MPSSARSPPSNPVHAVRGAAKLVTKPCSDSVASDRRLVLNLRGAQHRLLEATAEMMAQGAATSYDLAPSALKQLASTLAEDSAILRMLVDEQGTGASNRG
jgi:hypothetical protein